MWQIIRELVADGVTIFLTTQYLDEADDLADRIAVLDHGGSSPRAPPDELKRRIPGGHVRLRFTDTAGLDAAAGVFDGAARDDEALTLQVPSDGGVRSLRTLLDRLDAAVGRGRPSCRCTPPTSTTSSSPSPATRPTEKEAAR